MNIEQQKQIRNELVKEVAAMMSEQLDAKLVEALTGRRPRQLTPIAKAVKQAMKGE